MQIIPDPTGLGSSKTEKTEYLHRARGRGGISNTQDEPKNQWHNLPIGYKCRNKLNSTRLTGTSQ